MSKKCNFILLDFEYVQNRLNDITCYLYSKRSNSFAKPNSNCKIVNIQRKKKPTLSLESYVIIIRSLSRTQIMSRDLLTFRAGDQIYVNNIHCRCLCNHNNTAALLKGNGLFLGCKTKYKSTSGMITSYTYFGKMFSSRQK